MSPNRRPSKSASTERSRTLFRIRAQFLYCPHSRNTPKDQALFSRGVREIPISRLTWRDKYESRIDAIFPSYRTICRSTRAKTKRHMCERKSARTLCVRIVASFFLTAVITSLIAILQPETNYHLCERVSGLNLVFSTIYCNFFSNRSIRHCDSCLFCL